MWSSFFNFLTTLGGLISPITDTNSTAPVRIPLIDWELPVLIHLPDKPDLRLNVGPFVDRMMDYVRKKILAAELDPCRLRDFNFRHSKEDLNVSLSNGTFKGLSHLYLIGEVWIAPGFFWTEISATIAIANSSVEYSVDIVSDTKKSFKDGKVQFSIDNLTMAQTYTFTYITQNLKMSAFDVTLGNFSHAVIGLGGKREANAEYRTKVFEKVKDPLLYMFATLVKTTFNAAVTAAKTSLLAMLG